MILRKILTAASLLGLAACYPHPPPPPPPYEIAGTAMVTTASKPPIGTYLVDGSGRALYILEAQRNGAGLERCISDCLSEWPPLHSRGAPGAGGGVDPARFGTAIVYGRPQVTYSGWPLYYYHRDRLPADTTGHRVTDRWGTWHLLSPSGEPIRPAGSRYSSRR